MTLSNSASQNTILSADSDVQAKESLLVRLPARFVLTFYLCMGAAILFSHRVNLNIAIVAMVNSSSFSKLDVNDTELVCPTTSKDEVGEFSWSPSTQGVVLGAFYYGYVLTQVLGGRLSEKFSPKVVFISGIVASSIFTLLVPVVAEFSFELFIALRVIHGAAQGITFPASYLFVSRWFPSSERGFHLAIGMSGSILGTIITLPIAGYLCEEGFAGGWPSAFYVFGIVGITYALPFYLFIFDHPQKHPRISKKELFYIEEGAAKKQKKLPVPWLKVITSVPIWALTFTRITSAFAFFIVMTKIPAYMDSVLRYPVKENGLLNSILYLLEIISQVASGFMSDLVQKKGWLSTNATRKVFQTIASGGATVCLLSVPFVKCDGTAVIVLLTAALGILGLNSGGEMPTIVDMAPAFSGSLFGLTNSFSSSTGFLAPLIAGLFLDGNDRSMTQWSYVFFLSSGLCFAGCLVYLFLAEARLQPWAVVKEEEEDHGERKEKELERY